jgi:hypothetical protein
MANTARTYLPSRDEQPEAVVRQNWIAGASVGIECDQPVHPVRMAPGVREACCLALAHTLQFSSSFDV